MDQRPLEARRRSDGHNEPQMQVVGFHVEGQSPSPAAPSMLQDSLRTISSGSPTPVIIPPQFSRDPNVSRDAAANRALAPDFAAGQPASNVLRTTSDLSRNQGQAVTASLQLTSHPAPAAASLQQQQQQQLAATPGSSAAVSQQQPPPQQLPAAAAGNSTSSDEVAAAAPAAGPGDPSSSGVGVEATDAAAAALAADQQQKPPPKAAKPSSKAERRALQEAQRAAKAAAKGGGTAGPAAGGASTAKATADAAAASAAAAGLSTSGGNAAVSGKPPRAPPAQAGSSSSTAATSAGSRSVGGGMDGQATAKGPSSAGGQSSSGSGLKARGPLNLMNSTELFAHLQQYRRVTVEDVMHSKEGSSSSSSSVHPAVLALGLRYADGSITGSTARCVAMVNALCQVIADYHTPEGKSLPRDLLATINTSVDFLVRCRPLSVSMGNAIKALKLCISKIDPSAPEESAKSSLVTMMADWLQEKVAMADRVLVDHAVTKVYDGDVILTYAYSQVVLEVLVTAARQGKRFRVLVVDSRPELEGRQMLRQLLQADIACSYVFLSGLSYSIREVTKVVLGAAAVLSNGTVLSRSGSAAVAMCAAASSKPVLVCCEAFKFHERVQLDSITHNELGDPDLLAHLPPYAPAAAVVSGPADPAKGALSAGLANWQESPRLALLNLKYDAMPAEYVSMVVTEFGMIPPSSVPVILREYSESAQLD